MNLNADPELLTTQQLRTVVTPAILANLDALQAAKMKLTVQMKAVAKIKLPLVVCTIYKVKQSFLYGRKLINLSCLGSNASPPVENPAPKPQEQAPSAGTTATNPPTTTAPSKPASNFKCTQEGFSGDPQDCR